jgi:hypothetical protein
MRTEVRTEGRNGRFGLVDFSFKGSNEWAIQSAKVEKLTWASELIFFRFARVREFRLLLQLPRLA